MISSVLQYISMFSKNGSFVIRYAFFITLNFFYDSKLKL